MPCWQDSAVSLRRNVKCNEEAVNEVWMCSSWLLTTGDSADLAVCPLIRGSNSAGLFPFLLFLCFKLVPVAASLIHCVLPGYFALSETP